MPPKNDWNAYRELVLHEMKETGKQFTHITGALEDLRVDLASIKMDVGGLKTKAAIAGGAAGVIGTAIVTFVFGMFK